MVAPQDETGAAHCTHGCGAWPRSAFLVCHHADAGGDRLDKSLQHQWFSTMYGVYYFAGSVWFTLATVYLLAVWLQAPAAPELISRAACTISACCCSRSRCFTPTSTFAVPDHLECEHAGGNLLVCAARGWLLVGQRPGAGVGHFLLPFLLLLRIDAKLKLALMVPLCLWRADAFRGHFLQRAAP